MNNLAKNGLFVAIAAVFAAGVFASDEKNDSNFSPATLYLRGIQSDAEVIINDNLVKQPVTEPILTPPGYLHIMVGVKDTVFHKSFFVHPNEHKIFNFAADPKYAAIDLISEPLGATVSFDGKQLGVTPYIDSLVVPGLVSVVVEKYGYDSIRKEIQLLPQEEMELTLEMKHSTAWLDSVSKAKIFHRKKILFVQRVIFSAIGVASGGIAAYFDRMAQNNITAAATSAGAYDRATTGFQGYKNTYNLNRTLAQKNMERRNIAAVISAVAAAGLTITFFF